MDAIDLTIVRVLALDGRATFADLADRAGLSGPSVAERVRKLEERGVISGFSAIVTPAAVGLDLTAFIAVSLASPRARDAFLGAIAEIPGIVECHHVAGDDDYLLKARCAGTAGLEQLVSHRLKGIGGVARTHTTVVLSSAFERPLVPDAETP